MRVTVCELPHGGVGRIIDPDGALLASTSASEPFQTRNIDLAAPRTARATYPRHVFQPPH